MGRGVATTGATEQRNERLVVVHSVIADHGYGIDIAPLLP